ncbi:hypothetical protein O6H91_05G110000 [Diphasiastrum complanatum]|uniref:Uncharacterized protein n=1 Tax=Diphasiastrum complanatum TaxID=34168 RepID=A0ACC2DRZ7_DIPCM|nr:hypothetical protein O6H91_Y313800 [Diphasiastrum complanatum]KAJ7557052.1 hypothetical protein O6H91_05G110000 [Diphasiastrum complanatum]
MKEGGSPDKGKQKSKDPSLMAKLSAAEKEKTKLRERQRRAITTKIFSGLRKHGGYNLPPRADINDVLKALAVEAGWIVESDGTTYRRPQASQPPYSSQTYPTLRQPMASSRTASLTRSGSSLGGFAYIPGLLIDQMDSRGGDCSTTASPRHMGASAHSNSSSMTLMQPNSNMSSPFTSPASSEGAANVQMLNPFVGNLPSGFLPCGPISDGHDLDVSGLRDDSSFAYFSADTLEAREVSRNNINQLQNLIFNAAQQNQSMFGPRNIPPLAIPPLAMLSQQYPFLQEQRASNENTPLGSPQGHGCPGGF